MFRTLQRIRPFGSASLLQGLKACLPPVLYGVRLTAAVALALLVAFWLQLDDPNWAGTSAAIVCQPVLGASLRKGIFRLVGTLAGALATVLLTAVFPQDRLGFFLGLALWAAACSFVSTVLRNFSAYAAMLAGYTMAIIAGSSVPAPNEVFILAVDRASEIGLGIVAGMLVMALTDVGGSAARLSAALARLCESMLSGFEADLAAQPRTDFAAMQHRRRALLQEVVALDPLVDQAIGESGEIGLRQTTMRGGINGLFLALAAWRSVAVSLRDHPPAEAQRLAALVRDALPGTAPGAIRWPGEAARLARLRDDLAAAADQARRRPTGDVSARLAGDHAAFFAEGLGRAVNALALTLDPGRARRVAALPAVLVTDPLPPLVNAARVFVAVVASVLVYVATSWDSGLQFITFATVTVLLLSPQDEKAGHAALGFALGTVLTACLAAIVKFALLPNHESFYALVALMGLVLVPLAALSTRPSLSFFVVPAVMNFVPLLGPTNAISFDTVSFYNSALAIVGGCAMGSLTIWLIPPIPPAMRAARLVALTRDDLRRLARRPERWTATRWRARVYARVSALPATAALDDGAKMLTALDIGLHFLRLCGTERTPSALLDGCRSALAKGDLAAADTAARSVGSELADDGEEQRRRSGAVREITALLGNDPDYFGTRAAR